MRVKTVIMLLAGALFCTVATNARAQVSLGLSADEGGIRDFYIAVGQYYHVPEKEVLIVRERSIPDDDLPVVFFLAQRARVAPQAVIDLRISGKSWMDITLHYGLSPEIYYVKVGEVSGPPYGKAFGYFKNKPRKQWKEIRLGDDDIVNLVDLRFVSGHYGYAPDKVISMRSKGASFVQVNSDIKKGKEGKKQESAAKGQKEKGQSKRHGKDKAK